MYNYWMIVIGLAVFMVINTLIVFAISGDWQIIFLLNFIPAFAFIIFLCISIIMPALSKKEMIEFIECKEMVEQVVESGQDFENIGITQKIIEQNEWLAKARARKKHYKNWSSYIYCDLDSLDYIVIKKGEEK